MIGIEETNTGLTKKQQKQTDRLEKRIDKAIEKYRVPHYDLREIPGKIIAVNLWRLPELRFQWKLKSKYEKDGWILIFKKHPTPRIMICRIEDRLNLRHLLY